jgi:polyhydroxyalkanoate synthesis regulator phasin
MVEKLKVPAFIKDGAKAAMEPLNRLEDKVRDAIKKLSDDSSLPPAEVKKLLSEALNWIKGARADFEKSFSDGVVKTLSLLNLPSREDLLSIDGRVNKLSKDVKAIENKLGASKKPAPKPVVKKVVAKKAAVKKTTKKA